MVTKKSNTFLSCDDKTKINVVMWCPDEAKYEKPIAIYQIMHGMIEFIDRYDDFAKYLAERGILVVGNDHLGHGLSVGCDDDLGYFKDKQPENALVIDAHRLTEIVKKHYPDIPYYLMGHSMGSFMARKYICMYGRELDGVVIMGTGHQITPVVVGGKLMINLVGLLKGDRYRSTFLANAMFGSYGAKIKDDKTPNAWLTRDKEVVKAYNNNKLNTFLFTVNGYKGLIRTILFVRKKNNISKIPANLPMLMVSGLDDPVGEYGAGVRRAFKSYHNYLNDVDLRLYEDCRHEICNELNKEEIYEDIYEWVMEKLG